MTPTNVYAWGGLESGKVTPTSPKTIQVTGIAGVPSSGVSAVVVDVSAFSSTGVTSIFARTDPTESTGSIMHVGADGSAVSNVVIVRPNAAGTITITTNNQPAGLTVDVQGYFTDTVPEGASGGFVPTAPTRLVGTNDGVGLPKALLNAGTTYTAQIAGKADIPADAVAVFANVRVANSTADGALKLGPAGTNIAAQPVSLNYETGRYSDSGMTLALGTGTNAGKINLGLAPGSADVIIDVQGYFTAGSEGGGFTPLTRAPFYDSRTNDGRLQPGEVRTVQAAGLAGIPEDGTAMAVAATVSAFNWSAPGSVSVYNADLEDNNGTSNVGFRSTYTGVPEQTTAIIELSGDGTIAISNNTTGTLDVVLTTQGWFAGVMVDVPPDDTVLGLDALPCESAPCDPVLVTGEAPEDVESVAVYVDPSDGQTAPPDIEAPMVELRDAEITTQGEQFTVRMNPAEVAASSVSSGGVINLQIIGSSSSKSWQTHTSVRVVAVEGQEGAAWADVDDTADPALTLAPASTTRPSTSASSRAVEIAEPVAVNGAGEIRAASVLPTSMYVDPVGAAAARSGCKGVWRDEYKTPWVTIGTTYPTDDATGTMSITSSSGASYGVALSVMTEGGGWHESGSSFASGGWAKEYLPKKASRSYQIQVRYRKWELICSVPGMITRRETYWRPINEVGGAISNTGIKRPNWTRCAVVDPGPWHRFSSKGKEYKYGSAVKFKSVVGFDLSISRQYTKESRLTYNLRRKGRMCGNNGDPAVAGKVMHKKL
ncbi:hypothetical protein [Mumia sp. ZJ430]|uniref:hypothetical protein n=1 Tax=Mumia sp. ZJ430 TaxID=2708083 RepID=UPI0014230E00|nr:hypothetical protein [Mumia sp. ZJ430]